MGMRTGALDRIPRVRGVPGLGNPLAFRSRRLELLMQVQRECGDVGMIRLGPMPIVTLSAADLAHEVLVSRADLFDHMPLAGMYGTRRLFGRGMLVTEGAQHLAQRRRALPAFKPARVEGYVPTMALLVDDWRRRWADGMTLDLYEELVGLSLQVAQRILFGIEHPSENSALSRALTTCARCALDEVSSFVQLPLSVPTPRNRRFAAAIELLERTVAELVGERRARGSPGGDLLGALVAGDDEQPLSGTEIRDDLVNLFIAGYEAMASLLFWSVYELSRDGNSRERVDAELAELGGDALPRATDLERMPLLLAVLKESMRLYPANHIMFRRTVSALELRGYEIPAGTLIGINGYAIKRRPDVFPDPERFCPERFFQRDDQSFGASYFPFGAGPRWCIGAHYALTLARTALAVILRHHRFEVLREPQLDAHFAIVPRPGAQIRVRKAAASA